jgi:hypothetical protein
MPCEEAQFRCGKDNEFSGRGALLLEFGFGEPNQHVVEDHICDLHAVISTFRPISGFQERSRIMYPGELLGIFRWNINLMDLADSRKFKCCRPGPEVTCGDQRQQIWFCPGFSEAPSHQDWNDFLVELLSEM